MSEYIPDSPTLSRSYCPTCEPLADPLTEILDVRWCETHGAPARDGSEDARALTSGGTPAGTLEAGGEDNRAWCAVIHGASPR